MIDDILDYLFIDQIEDWEDVEEEDEGEELYADYEEDEDL